MGAKLIAELLKGAVGGGSSEEPCEEEAMKFVVCLLAGGGNIDVCIECLEAAGKESSATSCADIGADCVALESCVMTDCSGCADGEYVDEVTVCVLKDLGCDGTECGTSQGSSVSWI